MKTFCIRLFKNNYDSLTEQDFNNSNFKSSVQNLSASPSYEIEGPLTINEIRESLINENALVLMVSFLNFKKFSGMN